MFDELKPCPFCGGTAHLFVNNGVRVMCPKCGATSKCVVDSMHERKVNTNAVATVIDAWNSRCTGDSQNE